MSETNGDHRFEFFQRGVQQTLEGAGQRKLSAIRTAKAALLKEEQRLVAERPKVFIGVPAYNTTSMHDQAWSGLMIHPTDGENLTVTQSKFSNSLLARSFNQLWAQALFQRKTSGVTHFAMLHTDVAPEPFWVDKLWEEMVEHDANIMATVIPIKNSLGLTSVAIDNREDPWQLRRLTMTEVVEKLPETFCNDDVIKAGLNPDHNLLLQNTGCWLCDLRRPWVDAVDEAGNLRCYFTVKDCVRPLEGGYFVGVQPEDWNFSRIVQAIDPEIRIFGTRKVRLEHKGETGYPNQGAWGQWKTDQDWKREVETKATDEDISTAEAVKEPQLTPA